MQTFDSSGPRVIKRAQLKPNQFDAARASARPLAAAAPAVHVIRTGGAVRAIRIDCLCGRSFELECVMEENDQSKQS